MAKFSILIDGKETTYMTKNVFEIELVEGISRGIVRSKSGLSSIIIDWINVHDGHFGILYVLAVPGTGIKPGRYQVSNPCNKSEVIHFIKKYKDYFENDARHSIWFINLETRDQIIYDKHELLYIYGNLDKVKILLEKKGFKESRISIPEPHVHSYNPKYDIFEDKIMNYWDWKWLPLEKDD